MILQTVFVAATFVSLSVSKQVCSPGWTHYKGSCYSLGPNNLDHFDARLACEKQNGYLAKITKAHENTFVKMLAHIIADKEIKGVYIGAHYIEYKDIWEWQKPWEELTFSDWIRKNWQPDPSGFVNYCAMLSKAKDWAWLEYDCHKYLRMSSVCERNAGWRECHNGSCYELIFESMYFDDIKDRCKEIGGQVLEIDSEEENTFIKGFLRRASIPNSFMGVENVWLGLTDKSSEGKFRLMSNEKKRFNLKKWMHGEPNNLGLHGKDEDCVVLDAAKDWKWNDVMCYTKNAVVCESKTRKGKTRQLVSI